FREMFRRVSEAGGMRGSTFDVNIMKVVLDEMVTEAGVKPLYHTRAIGVVTEPGDPWDGAHEHPRVHLKGLLIHNKSGIQTVRAHTFVDCTGDGDVAAWAGAPFEFGREQDDLAQPMTMMFRLGGCKWTGGTPRHPVLEGIHMSIYHNPNPGEITFNMTRISGLKGTSGEDMTRAEIEGRKMVMEYVKLIKDNIPGFEDAYLVGMPTQIGVRETRHIHGATVLSEQQVLDGDERGDVIARCQYSVDIHNPDGKGARIVRLKDPYDIPYRCLIPRGVDNLLVTGRAISADHAAHSSLRIQPTSYAIGQAAGTAAAICVRENVGPWEMQPWLRELQRTLIGNGADLGPLGAMRVGMLDEWRDWQERYRTGRMRPWPTSFTDIPEGHPAYQASVGLAKARVFQGYSDGTFGVTQIVPAHIVAVVLARALKIENLEEAKSVKLRDDLEGHWWTPAVRALVHKGIVEQYEVEQIGPDDPVAAWELEMILQRAFNCGSLGTLPEELAPGGTLTRGGLAILLWRAMEQGKE
ncbi:MAG: FAD-dependent oxidoreductase, partial [Armatimonadota bacterium]